MDRVHKLTISRKDRFVQISGFQNSGKTTYLLGVAYMMYCLNRKVVWLSITGFPKPSDHATVEDCWHLWQLIGLLEKHKDADVIILDDMHQLITPHDKSGVDLLIAFCENIPEGQERYLSMTRRHQGTYCESNQPNCINLAYLSDCPTDLGYCSCY